MKRIVSKWLIAFISSMFFCSFALSATAQEQGNIVAVAKHTKNLTTFVKAIEAAGLVDTLQGTGSFTVFAPTNEAFAKLPKKQFKKLMHDKKMLTAVLTYHVVPSQVLAKDIQNGSIKTVEGQVLDIQKKDGHLWVNHVKVLKADIHASNGVIHEIDTVLLPADMTKK